MEQDTKMEADSTLPEGEKEVGTSAVQEDDGKDVEPSAENEDNRKEAMSSAEDIKIKEGFPAEQVDDRKETETPVVQEFMNTYDAGSSAEKCSKPRSKKNSKVLKVKRKILKKSPAGSLLKTSEAQCEPEDAKKEKEVPTAQDAMENPEAEKCRKSESCTKKFFKGLKVKRKIVKKSPAFSLLKSNKAQGSLTVKARGREKKNKSVLQVHGVSNETKVKDAEQLNGKEDTESSVSKEEQTEKSEETDNGQERTSELENSHQDRKNEEKGGSSDKSKSKSQKNKKKDHLEKVRRKKYKKRLGGLIFMCNEKTRSDCFYYRVMGVSAGKKDVVLAIKPGLKLFLYDVDLKLLYGIYRASSSGGMKLESKAFHGAFPAQVRFKVFKDCVPLPERIFKKAIKENYYQKHKFKAELSDIQVRKLSRLFRPVEFHSSGAALRSPPRVPNRNRNVHGGDREVRSRDPNSKGNARNRHQLSHERDWKVACRVEASRHREEASRDLYLSEKEYQTYGLPTERRKLDPVPRLALETYHRDYDRDYHHRHVGPSRYRDVVLAGTVRTDPVYLVGEDYPAYRIDPRPELSPPRTTRYAYDPYHSCEYGAPSVDPYLLPLRREGGDRHTYSARNYAVDTESTRHAADAPSYYNQRRHEKLETNVMPVTSRYSFAGPSYSYR